MKYIYLDQNWWIYLAKGWYDGKGEIYGLVCDLKNKIAEGDIKVVVSLTNIMEAQKRADNLSRNRLLDFMMDISQGYAISPFRDWIIDFEVENLFLKKIGKEVDLRSKVIGEGLSALFGAIPSIKGDFSKELKEEMIRKVNSLETFRMIISLPEVVKRRREETANLAKETQRFEEVRQKERIFKDKVLQYKVVLAKYFQDFIFNRIIYINLKYGFPKDFLFKLGMGMKEIMALFQELPATYSYFALVDRRDRDLNKKIDKNDLNDLFSFTMGVAYCDIVFGEKMFTNLAKHSKLDKLYNTIITSSLAEFKRAIS